MLARPEPRTREEMHARKLEIDRRQAEAAARRTRPASVAAPVPASAAAPVPASSPPPSPPEPVPAAPAAAAVETPSAPGADSTPVPEDAAPVATPPGVVPADRVPRRIIARVAAQFGLTFEDVVGEGRDATVMQARDAALTAVKAAHPKRSLPWLGREFGRDHTTILHALRRLGLAEGPPPNPILAALRADADGMRAIEPLALPDLARAAVGEAPPTFRLVEPRALLVDEAYQRGLSEQSLRLIRRIVAEWSWRAFKPPIVVEGEGGLHVIDGQHTAIAAATHGGIAAIPVMVVEAANRTERAAAFVRHNRDRLHITGAQMHVSLVAAGDAVAVGVEEACRQAGARILRSKATAGRYRVGDTMAIEALSALVRRRGVDGAVAILRTCVAGEQAPIRAEVLRAVETLLTSAEHAGAHSPETLGAAFLTVGPSLERKVSLFAATHRVARWQAVMAVLAQHVRRPRAAA